MKKVAVVFLVLGALLLGVVQPSEAWGRGGGGRGHHHFNGNGRVFVRVGPSFWWGWGPYPYWYYDYPPSPYYYVDPATLEPPVYIEQPTPPTPAPASQAFWYYCQSANAYYPMVQSCGEPWVQVSPRP